MSYTSINIYGFELPAESFTIVTGDDSLQFFNEFLNKHNFVFLWSGLDWGQAQDVEEYKLNDTRNNLEAILIQIRNNFKLEGIYSLWFDNGKETQLIKGGVHTLMSMVVFFDKNPEWFQNDYWIFSETSGLCIEIYHEDIVTIGYGKEN